MNGTLNPIDTIPTLQQQTVFVVNDQEKITQSLANYLPGGEFFRAKNIHTSNFRKLLNSLSYEFQRAEDAVVTLINELDITRTVTLLEAWEGALGIPDECFSTEERTVDLRRKYAVAKYALMNVQTRKNFIELAEYFGYNITIENGSVYSEFPFTLPFILAPSVKIARFTVVITFVDLEAPEDSFPLTIPFTLGSDETAFLRCLFLKLAPLHVKLEFRYKTS